VPTRFYPFVQLEMPFELGPPDGRWMVRDPHSQCVQRVIVLETVVARRADRRPPARRRSLRRRFDRAGRIGVERRRAAATAAGELAAPPAVPVARVTVVHPQPIEQEQAAGAWLHGLDAEQEVEIAFAALNRLLAAHRLAAADPYAREVTLAQALAIRAGFGTGEQVAQGRWLQTRELTPPRAPRRSRRRRAAILGSQERLARLLASEQGALLCEELALRARLDLDGGRLAHAASELERALATALVELEGEPGPDMPRRVAELRELHAGVGKVAERLLATPAADPTAADADLAVISHALRRLEAALRARATAIAWR
jgi:hypothetical protein